MTCWFSFPLRLKPTSLLPPPPFFKWKNSLKALAWISRPQFPCLPFLLNSLWPPVFHQNCVFRSPVNVTLLTRGVKAASASHLAVCPSVTCQCSYARPFLFFEAVSSSGSGHVAVLRFLNVLGHFLLSSIAHSLAPWRPWAFKVLTWPLCPPSPPFAKSLPSPPTQCKLHEGRGFCLFWSPVHLQTYVRRAQEIKSCQ